MTTACEPAVSTATVAMLVNIPARFRRLAVGAAGWWGRRQAGVAVPQEDDAVAVLGLDLGRDGVQRLLRRTDEGDAERGGIHGGHVQAPADV